jgi:hypothetical protein
MTPRRLALLVVLIAAVPALAQRAPRWELHVSRDGKFQVKLPGKVEKPETKELALGSGGQTVTLTTERAEGPGKSVFAVTFADYPESYRQVPPKTILDGVRDGLKGTDGRVEEKEVLLGEGAHKLAGREFRVVAGNRVVLARVFLKDTRLYQVMVTGTKDGFPNKLVDDFLGSFELTK